MGFQDYTRRSGDAVVRGPRIRLLSYSAIALACVVLLLLSLTARGLNTAYAEMAAEDDRYVSSELAAYELKHASDLLTSSAQLFAVTGEWKYARQYFTEAVVSMRRERAVETLQENLGGTAAAQALERAMAYSLELMELEYESMLLVMSALDYTPDEQMTALTERGLTAEQLALSGGEKLALASELVHNEAYEAYDNAIEAGVEECVTNIVSDRDRKDTAFYGRISRITAVQELLSVVMGFSLAGMSLVIVHYVISPLLRDTEHITRLEPLDMRGGYELQYLAKAFNAMLEDNRRYNARLRHEAEHDPLTGLYNRGAFRKLWQEHADRPLALLLMDVDKFKDINDGYGHAIGDQVLKKVAELLDHTFRQSDFPCRMGGDEFAVIMTDAVPEMRQVIEDKLLQVTEALGRPEAGLPRVTLSAGVSFSGPGADGDRLYREADAALYTVKEQGRNGHAFFSGEDAGQLLREQAAEINEKAGRKIDEVPLLRLHGQQGD